MGSLTVNIIIVCCVLVGTHAYLAPGAAYTRLPSTYSWSALTLLVRTDFVVRTHSLGPH